MSSINLPRNNVQNTDQPVRDFFDRYFQRRIEYSASEVDAVLGFFNKRGFDEASSSSIATVILQQAIVDQVDTFKILDTLKKLDETQLSAFVAEILNLSRVKSSALGFKSRNTANFFEARNIIQ